MTTRLRWFRTSWVIAVLAAACNETTTQPTTSAVVDGTWDARFEGIVDGLGTRQTDMFLMEVRQSGSNVTGSLRFNGLSLIAPLTGSVNGTVFMYAARALLRPGCDVVVSADVRLDGSAMRLSGSQTQSTCEGVATGQVVATRR